MAFSQPFSIFLRLSWRNHHLNTSLNNLQRLIRCTVRFPSLVLFSTNPANAPMNGVIGANPTTVTVQKRPAPIEDIAPSKWCNVFVILLTSSFLRYYAHVCWGFPFCLAAPDHELNITIGVETNTSCH